MNSSSKPTPQPTSSSKRPSAKRSTASHTARRTSRRPARLSLADRLVRLIRSLGGQGGERAGRPPMADKARTVLGLVLLGVFAFVTFTLLVYTTNARAIYSQIHTADPEAASSASQEAIGSLGAYVGYYLFNGFLGWSSFVIAALLLYAAVALLWLRRDRLWQAFGRSLQLLAMALWLSLALASLQHLGGFGEGALSWGGAVGEHYRTLLSQQLGGLGLVIVLIVTLLVILVLLSNRVLLMVNEPERMRPERGWRFWRSRAEADDELDEDELDEDEDAQAETPDQPSAPEGRGPLDAPAEAESPSAPSTALRAAAGPEPEASSTEDGLIITKAPADELIDPKAQKEPQRLPGMLLEHYQKPPLDLLREYSPGGIEIDKHEIEFTKQRILETLASFKIYVTPHKATIGPTVTLYEIVPEQGVKVSRIKSLENDLMLALKSQGIRIIAPMPGQGTVGIEVPNKSPQTVSMRSIMASKRFSEAMEKMELPIGMGKTITNEPFVFDLCKMPHLLIAGATGQGKSVGLNALITSLLYSKRPEELKLIMVDPKMLEFSIYEGLEQHFMAMARDADKAIITDMTKVVPMLNALCVEMDNRYMLLSQAKVRNIKDYNEQLRSGQLSRLDGFDYLPYIVLIVDEWADLIMTSGREAEQPIARLAQKARAAGIHLVLATQRPSTDVVTGLIKANFPARIAFKVSSSIDSGTILGNPSAHNLIGRGDMLFFQGNELIRVQCAFMDTPETEAIVRHISQQEHEGHAYELPEYVPEADSGRSPREFHVGKKDELFEEAARLIVTSQMGSASLIQRKMEIGFARAGRLVDQLEAAGIVGPQRGSKPREVLIPDLIALDALLANLEQSGQRN